MKRIFLALVTLLAGDVLHAQYSLNLRPDGASGEDAMVFDFQPNTNFGSGEDLEANAWTFTPTPGVVRSFLKFDYSALPPQAVITSAYLSLFQNYSSSSGNHSQQSGSNAAVLQRVTAAWDENTINWNNQPAATATNEASVHPSNSANENYPNIDVTALVQDIIASGTNNGFLLKLVTEQHYRRLTFASSDHADSTLHPIMQINYTLPELTCVTLLTDSESGYDAMIFDLYPNTNYGTFADLQANAWTFTPTPGLVRSLLKFDFGSIPGNAIIDSALLSLYENTGSSSGDHSQQSGSNEAWLQRVVAPWNEQTVTWNNQPNAAAANQVAVHASNYATENYLDINVKPLVQDMLNSDNYGFLLKLNTEQHYRRLNFASSDHADFSKHPSLKICYSVPSAIVENKLEAAIMLYPNPANDELFIETNGQELMEINIYNTNGSLVSQTKQVQNKHVDINQLAKGVYIAEIKMKDGIARKRFVKM